MVRPCFLVVDREYSGSISTRKLVLETAKYNVITAYSGVEAIETLKRFPALDAVVMDASPRDMTCVELVSALWAIRPGIRIVTVGVPGATQCGPDVLFLPSFDPAKLLEVMRSLNPEVTAEIEARNDELAEGRS